MRVIFGLVLIIGVGLAGFAVYVAKDRFTQYQDALASQRDAIVPTTSVYVVNREMRYGEQIRPADVEAIEWPEASVPFGAFTSAEELFPEGEDLRTVLRVMERNEPVLITKVSAPGADAGVASRLERGMRAFALRGENVTRLIQASVPIIAIDQISDQDRRNPTVARTITIAAPAHQIAALAQAQATGALSLSLVGVRDDSESETIEVDQDALLGIAQAVEAEGPEICTVRNRRGAEVIVTQVPCTN